MMTIVQTEALLLWLAALHGDGEGWCEVRRRRVSDGKWLPSFFPVSDRERAAGWIERDAETADVYVGVLARSEKRGTAAACLPARALWADCDTAEAVERALNLDVAPRIVIETSPGHAHVYFPIRPLPAEWVRTANRRIANYIGADLNACDAARVMRPPATTSHKYEVPRNVRCVRLEIGGRAPEARQIVGDMQDPAPPRAQRPGQGRPAIVAIEDDPHGLDSIPSIVYAPLLTGREPNRDGKIVCPFHADTDPSMQLFQDADRGHYCYGCGRGGSIVDFGAELYGLKPRGADFWEIRRRLAGDLLAADRGSADRGSAA